MSDLDVGSDEIFASVKHYASQCVNCQRHYQLLHVWCFDCNIGTCYTCSVLYCSLCDTAKCINCKQCHRCANDSDDSYDNYDSDTDSDSDDLYSPKLPNDNVINVAID